MRQYGPLIAVLLVVLGIEIGLIGADLSKAKEARRVAMSQPILVAGTLSLGGGGEAPVAETSPVPAPIPTTPAIVSEVKSKPKVLDGPLVLPVRAWLAVYVSPQGERRVLTGHNETKVYPIASLSKLITAIVVREQIDPGMTLTLDHELEVIEPGGTASSTTWTVAAGDLLFPLLIESNNNAATALASVLGPKEDFIAKMNETAKKLGMTSTHFINPHGLDPTDDVTPNEASAADLERLAEAYFRDYPALLGITKQEQFALWSLDGEVIRRFTNTNRLLDSNNWPAEVLGGKTGYTDLADRNLLLVLRDKKSGGIIYTVVLGTNNHFAATSDLLDWVYYNYKF